MTDTGEVKQAITTLLDRAIQHGPLGYFLHRGLKAGQVSSIVFATTDPQVIAMVLPALSEVEQLP
jgi:hypothetical protein